MYSKYCPMLATCISNIRSNLPLVYLYYISIMSISFRFLCNPAFTLWLALSVVEEAFVISKPAKYCLFSCREFTVFTILRSVVVVLSCLSLHHSVNGNEAVGSSDICYLAVSVGPASGPAQLGSRRRVSGCDEVSPRL